MPAIKVGTCNYCGTRAALVLTGDKRHELACSNCGAPLHDLKIMPAPAKAVSRQAHRARPTSSHAKAMSKRDKPTKKPKKKKSFKQRALSELWDFVEDIFD